MQSLRCHIFVLGILLTAFLQQLVTLQQYRLKHFNTNITFSLIW